MSIESSNRQDIEAIRTEVDRSIEHAVDDLRKTEAAAQRRLHDLTVEQNQLGSHLNELHYRHSLRTQPDPFTGPLSDDQLKTIERQEETLLRYKAELEKTTADLEQVGRRVSWLIHQIEGAVAWVLAPIENNQASDHGRGLQPDSGEQVMWAQIIMGQEAERARLAREIHDGPAQALANTVMRLQFVEQMYRHQPEEVEHEIARLRIAVQDSLKDVRRFVSNLRPASLSDIGLVATLREYTRDYAEQYGVDLEMNVPDNLSLSPDQELVVFRVIQEALQNIHKHAEATNIGIDLAQRKGGPLVVTINDNGKGFNPTQVRQRQPSSSGLVSMKERAATVGGTLQIDSTAGTGTTIALVLPMPKEAGTY